MEFPLRAQLQRQTILRERPDDIVLASQEKIISL